ncbi:hypothetical protein GFJ94_00320 [Flavobacterium sp. LMO8]|uniref:hypothetical protein n=1 Tax=Flavobacterium sp. LMO8 TaxID=2654244 RepID=UPI0012914E97|nr:hypothetical protein [Flavobacterium sp. LMO8]MQP23509.1 hypothetical protein [Flavobacterium sp. LMO8]
MRTILYDTFETNLGEIELSIKSEYAIQNSVKDNLKVETENHKIEVLVIDLNQLELPEQMKIESSKVWRIFIEKKTEKTEKLHVICKLTNINPENTWGYDSGENLDAVEIENGKELVHIGTEDGEVMKWRAENNDWFPIRLKNEISIEKPITNYIDFGFESIIPNLEINEKLYLHFLIATRKKAEKNDNENISTWIAVDNSKKELDELNRKYGL